MYLYTKKKMNRLKQNRYCCCFGRLVAHTHNVLFSRFIDAGCCWCWWRCWWCCCSYFCKLWWYLDNLHRGYFKIFTSAHTSQHRSAKMCVRIQTAFGKDGHIHQKHFNSVFDAKTSTKNATKHLSKKKSSKQRTNRVFFTTYFVHNKRYILTWL